MKTVQDLRNASVLDLCYSDDEIEAFIARRDAVGWTAALLELPAKDACWALSGWLNDKHRRAWAEACANRANEYARDAADAAAYAAAYAATCDADRTARTARDAAAYAAARTSRTARDATHAAARAAASAAASAAHAAVGHADNAVNDAAAAAADAVLARGVGATAFAEASDAVYAEYNIAIRHGVLLLEDQLKGGAL